MPQQLLHSNKQKIIGSDEGTQIVDEPTDKMGKDVQAKSLVNEVKFTTNNKLFTSTIRNYFPNLPSFIINKVVDRLLTFWLLLLTRNPGCKKFLTVLQNFQTTI